MVKYLIENDANVFSNFLNEKYLKNFIIKTNDYLPSLPDETDYYAVFVEPRIDIKTLYIIKNHLYI